MPVFSLVFNPFGVNCYIIDGGNGGCILIDPACYGEEEQLVLVDFLESKKLKPMALINTHYHVDHIAGNTFVVEKYGLEPVCHPKSRFLWETAKEFGTVFGFRFDDLVVPSNFVEDGDPVQLGHIDLEVLYTPGHADGSICLVNHKQKYVVTGDVIFRDSIGRTDLPTGNYDVLAHSIQSKLFTLPNDYIIYPGHGPASEIGYEKLNNPFL